MASYIERREFLATLGGAAAAWPLAARAQQAGKLPTVGLLVPGTPSSHGQWTAAFVQRLRELGWTEGRNLAIEYRWAEGHTERLAELAYLRAGEALASSLGIEPVPTLVENATDIERAIASFASAPNGGLVVIPDVAAGVHRDLIIALAARHRASGLLRALLGRGWRAHVLRERLRRRVSAGGILC